jgi:hypothetical protein
VAYANLIKLDHQLRPYSDSHWHILVFSFTPVRSRGYSKLACGTLRLLTRTMKFSFSRLREFRISPCHARG